MADEPRLARRSLRALAVLSALAGCAGASAQTLPASGEPAAVEPARLPPVEVKAYRIPVLLEDLSYSVELLPRSELHARQPLTVAEALRGVPGLHVDRLGGPGGVANVYMRGAEPNHTLVLIDGVRVNDPNDVRGGSYDLSSLTVHDVERIEVLRGAHSAAFGADAMGGVVNIVTTRGGQGRRASARAAAGGQGLRDIGAAASLGPLAIGASRLEDGASEGGSRLRVGTASASLAFAPSAAWSTRLGLRATSRRSEAFPESSGGIRLATLRELERRKVDEDLLSLDSDLRPERGPRWNLRLARFERMDEIESPGVAPGSGGFVPASRGSSRLVRDSAALSAAFEGLPAGAVATFGVEYQRERGRADTLIPVLAPAPSRYALSRRTRSAFGELRLQPMPPLLLVLSARRDEVSSLAAVTSRSAGVRYAWHDGATVLRANWSEGFKPPSFFALGSPLVGNPELEPETSRTVELGLDVDFSSALGLQTTLFRNRYAALIDFDPESFRLVNRDRVSNEGIELSVRWSALPALTIDAGYTHVRYDSATPLRNRPRQRGSIVAALRAGAATRLRASLVHVGGTRDFSVPVGDVMLQSYDRLDLSLVYEASPHVTLEAALDNALDERYESFVGFREPGARLRVGLSIATQP